MRDMRATLVRRIILVGALVVSASLSPVASAPAQASGLPTYRTVDLGFAGHSTAINDNRQVVGELLLGTEYDFRNHPFLWEQGRHIDLGVLATGDFEYGRANDINNHGQIVGQSAVAPGIHHAFLWEHGVMTDLGTLGGEWSEATRINDRGQIIGSSQNAAGAWRSFLWQDGVMIDLGPSIVNDINNRGQVVGGQWFGDSHNAVLLDKGDVTRLDLRPSSAAAINDAGTTVGALVHDETETTEAYLWRAGEAVNIGAPETYTSAIDINDRGEVLIRAIDGMRLWRDGTSTPLVDLGVIAGGGVVDLNNHGDIVASSYNYEQPFDRATVHLR
jgi:probable HAF family extracellular repeat protein